MSLAEKAVELVWNKLKVIAEKGVDDEAKGGVKTLFTEAIKRIQPTHQERVAKSLLTDFAKLLEQQFSDHQVFQAEGLQLADDVVRFLNNPSVQGWLAEPLDPSISSLNYDRLASVWRDLKLTALPEVFEWDIVARRYLTKVRAAIDRDPQLQLVANHHTFSQIRIEIGRLAGLDPGFRLEEYRSRIRSRYGYMKFDSFHVTGSDLYRRVQLSKVFIPQNVKEDLPPIELPKEHIRRLEATGEISARESRELTEEFQLEQYRRRYQNAPRHVTVPLLRDPACPYAVMIGDPGSGKSTLLEWLLLDWAEDPGERPLPLFVELRQCARESSDWKGDFCQYFAVAASPLFPFNAAKLDEHLRANDSVLLVDGLDEVFDLNQRKDLTERILNFKARYSRSRVVVTSRKIG